MNKRAQLYDSSSIDSLDWPDTIDGQYAKAALVPLVKKTVPYYISNIHADLYVLKLDSYVFPILVTADNYSNSWVCSPYAHYIAYGMQFSGLIENRCVASLVKGFLYSFGHQCRMGHINSVAYVNNWMFSTDLYPAGIRDEDIEAIVELLTHKFPAHAIIFRSLNPYTNPALLHSLQLRNFQAIASRYVFVTNARHESIYNTRILKSDLRLWKEHSDQMQSERDLHLSDCAQILELHRKVYTYQRSDWQPDFNEAYVKMLFENKLLKFKVVKSEFEIRGVAGYFVRDQVMMCPLFGYVKESAESNTLYRLLNTALLLEAKEQGLLFHQSAGASFFKSIRRAEGCLEYMVVYTRHLPSYRRLVWSTLALFMNHIGAKYMKKY